MRIGRYLAIAAAIIGALILLLAVFPWGLFVGAAIAPLSRAVGRPVTIEQARRVDFLSFNPTVELQGVRVAQPDWAGPGALAEVRRARVTFPIWPLLTGKFRPSALDIDGLALNLVRQADGRSNWQGDGESQGRSSPPKLEELNIVNSRVRLSDAKRQVRLDATLLANARQGLVVTGKGTHRNTPLSVALRGAALVGGGAGKPYPVTLAVRSPLVTIAARARMDRPLDTDHFSASIVTRGGNLTYLDDIIQAGLFPTQRIDLRADIRHDDDVWKITRLGGTIGRSRLTASLTVAKQDGRTKLDGTVDAATLDFDDLASDAQLAKGAARHRQAGPRVIPDTRIRLDKVGATLDGTLRLTAHKLLSRSGSPFQSVKTTAVLDHRRLTLNPLTVGLRRGQLAGRLVDDHRKVVPQLSLDVRLSGGRIETLIFPKGELQGPLTARIALRGSGDTVRRAIGGASGTVGIFMPGGTVRRDYATFLGGDVFKSIGAAVKGGDKRADVRCLIASFKASGGVLTPKRLVLDTAVAGARGEGRITLADEAIDLRLRGRSKKPGLLQSTAPVRVFGTLSDPRIDVRPPRAERQGKAGMLERLGFLVKGLRTRGDAGRDVPAPAVDCSAAS